MCPLNNGEPRSRRHIRPLDVSHIVMRGLNLWKVDKALLVDTCTPELNNQPTKGIPVSKMNLRFLMEDLKIAPKFNSTPIINAYVKHT